ncbi:hypothetical protein GCM10009128_16860 [Psychrosphaera haliotis]|uniref:Kelch repeat-containing protein n=1 Tax=Psychrosphaera haliotis TaxID=555083 RepID=UPI0031D81E0F
MLNQFNSQSSARTIVLGLLFGLFSLSLFAVENTKAQITKPNKLILPNLPIPTSANTTAVIDDGEYLNILTFMGLTQLANKLDVSSQAWKLKVNKSTLEIEKATPKTRIQIAEVTILGNKSSNSLTRDKDSSNSHSADSANTDLTKNDLTKNDLTKNELIDGHSPVEKSSNEFWQEITAVPTEQKQKGRFAASSVVLENKVYILGGYSTNTVAQPKLNPNKQNITDFYNYDFASDTYQQLADMPVPVDDTLMLAYQDRYIYVISGWHKDGAVNLVQVFDTLKNEWFQASPLLGNGRFGHAGGIIDNQILVCDGMERVAQVASSAVMKIKQSCILGEISPFDPTKISWVDWVHPGEKGKFRMAAFSDVDQASITFVGGAEQQYDVNGETSNGKLVEPNSEIWVYHANKRSWSIKESSNAIADLKTIIKVNNSLITIGGRDKTGITNGVLSHN